QQKGLPGRVAELKNDVDVNPRAPFGAFPRGDLEGRRVRSRLFLHHGASPSHVAIYDPRRIGVQRGWDRRSAHAHHAKARNQRLAVRRSNGLKVAPEVRVKVNGSPSEQELDGSAPKLGRNRDERRWG